MYLCSHANNRTWISNKNPWRKIYIMMGTAILWEVDVYMQIH